MFKGVGPFNLRVKLSERIGCGTGKNIGVWDFESIDNTVKGIDINFSRFDFYSVRLAKGTGSKLACSFFGGKHKWTTNFLNAKVDITRSGIVKRTFLEFDIVTFADELNEINKRFRLSDVTPIEWFFVELTNHCNFRCQWCPSRKMTRDKGIMPLKKAKTLLEEIARYQRENSFLPMYAEIKNQTFLHVMGEPLLHPDFFKIIHYGHNLGLDFCLVTNASFLCYDTLYTLLDLGLKNVILSLNAPDAKRFTKTGSRASYRKVITHIQELVRERYKRKKVLPRIEIQLLNTRGVNLDDCSMVEDPKQVEEQLSFWSSFVRDQEHKSGMVSYILESHSPSRWQTILDCRPGDPSTYFRLGENLFLVFKQACNFANKLIPDDMEVHEIARGHCPFNNAHRIFCVLWDGSCTFCSLDYDNEVNLGNVFEEGIKAIWAGERMCRIRRSMERDVLIEPICRRCLGSVTSRSDTLVKEKLR
jgi:MoaA/NifB/PqqE/SkfB family radical SAM enzyme